MTRLRVGLDITSAVKQNLAGIAVYVRGLVEALVEHERDLALALYIRDSRWLKRRLVADLAADLPRHWLLTGARWELRAIDRFHGLGVRLPKRPHVPRSFTLHDLRGIEAQEYTDEHWVQVRSAKIRQTVARADGVLFHSEHACERFKAHFPESAALPTAVAHPGIDHGHFRPVTGERVADMRQRLDLAGPYLLQVGTPVPHKNPDGCLRAFAASEAHAQGLQLVFAGAPDSEYQPRWEALAAELGIADQVRWLGRVPYSDLPALYSGAAAVLMPSHYEGFGFPVVEAMACGARGVASAGTSLEELANGVWPCIDPSDDAALQRAIDEVSAGAHEPEAAAMARAAQFTWAGCAARTAEFLRRSL